MFCRIKVFGAVQGVGFRPYIYREAKKRGLKGYVKNTSSGVEILVNDSSFVDVLKNSANFPPLLRIDDFDVEKVAGAHSFFDEFTILESKVSSGTTQILPDVAVCADCVLEINNSKNRRFNYHFTTCTNCGPRFSMVKNMPYDRDKTSMSDFNLCGACKKEYASHSNRRYHAQTIACNICGPVVEFMIDGVKKSSGFDAIKKTANAIKNGKIVAIKGVGGYHLVCDAKNDNAIKRLRNMIFRKTKPLALMAKSVDDILSFVKVSDVEREKLLSYQRPIVVLDKLSVGDYSFVSPLNSIGVMLPYSSLHHLLLDLVDNPIVMTSCNLPGEPTAINSQKLCAVELTHNRNIVNRVDDSVVKVVGDNCLFLRRSRGYVPTPIDVFIMDVPDILAFGANESNTVAVYKNGKVFLSQHIGNIDDISTFDFLKTAVDFLLKSTGANVKYVVCDMHPDYYTTQYAKKIAENLGAKIVFVQHHLAHVYSVALENNLSSFIGIACDGSGYGLDETTWGGEVFLVDGKKTHENVRVGHLEEQILVGGDMAVLDPKRMLYGIFSKFLNEKELNSYFSNRSSIWGKQIRNGFNVVRTTSTGRMLDAAAYFLGVCDERTYSGEPAIVLESFAGDVKPYDLDVVIEKKESGVLILKTTLLFEFLWKNKDLDKRRLAATVHDYIARGLLEIAKSVSGDLPIVFSGGVAYNKYITRFMVSAGVIVNSKVPCGDGGISFGQIGYFLNNYDS